MIVTKCYNRILSAGIKELSSDIFISLYAKIREYLPSSEIINKPDMPCIWGSSLTLVSENIADDEIKDFFNYVYANISICPLPKDKSIFSSDWLEWCKDNRFNINKYSYGISYYLKNSAKVLEINSLDDYLNLILKYPNFIDGSEAFYKKQNRSIIEEFKEAVKNKPDSNVDDLLIGVGINFKEMKKDFDAFHLTKEAFYELRLIYPDELRRFGQFVIFDFYSYDCESWLIFNYDAIDQSSIWVHENLYDINYYKEQN